MKTETGKVNCVGIAQCIDNTSSYCYPLKLSVAVAAISVHG